MINTTKLTSDQQKLVNEIIKQGKGRLVYQRKELKALHFKLRGRTASPYFIVKNHKAKPTATERRLLPYGSYTLRRFVVASDSPLKKPMGRAQTATQKVLKATA